MKSKNPMYKNPQRGETEIGILLGALFIGILCFVGFSFMDWWKDMKTERGNDTKKYFYERNKVKNPHIPIKIDKAYKMSFTRDKRN